MLLIEQLFAGQLPLAAPKSELRPLFASHGPGDGVRRGLGLESHRDPASARSVGRCHVLCERTIDEAVRQASPGNYALGYFDGSDFTVFYVGRADSDLNASLHGWVGAPSRPRRHASSPCAPWRSRSGPLADLGTRALGHIAVGLDTGYTHFSFCYAHSAFAAFERECRDYHDLGGCEGLDNEHHPEPVPASRWVCPVQDSPECARVGV